MKRRALPLCCPCCSGRHHIEDCKVGEREGPERPRLPLAVPSHNGEYRGTVPVRVLPQGVSGEDHPKGGAPPWGVWKEKSDRGHKAQSRAAEQRHKGPLPMVRCKSGRHPMDEENTVYRKDGQRHCKACRAEYKRLHRKRKAQRENGVRL